MPKKVIQTPIDEELLKLLNSVSQSRHQSRSELIREACQHYLTQLKKEQLDQIYQEGYQKFPEQADLGEAQASLVSQVLSEESW